jgi:antitoxin ParD1/3/4
VNVSLTQELEKMVAQRVASGRYASASEVIREALRLLDERDRLAELRREVQAGVDDLDRSDRVAFDSTTAERIKQAGRARRKGVAETRRKAR